MTQKLTFSECGDRDRVGLALEEVEREVLEVPVRMGRVVDHAPDPAHRGSGVLATDEVARRPRVRGVVENALEGDPVVVAIPSPSQSPPDVCSG